MKSFTIDDTYHMSKPLISDSKIRAEMETWQMCNKVLTNKLDHGLLNKHSSVDKYYFWKFINCDLPKTTSTWKRVIFLSEK
jgi:hypothetical protein